jgi:cAMP-dependent protein kinase regulator
LLELVVFSKSEETKACLFGALLDHFLFESLSEEDLIQIVDCMSPLSVNEGDIIITEGEAGDLFYCLEIGVVSACVHNVGEVMKYESGGCFGELALLYNCPRAASVMALTDCSLWTLDLK